MYYYNGELIGDENKRDKHEFMIDAEISEANSILAEISENRGHMGRKYAEWGLIETAYRGDQPIIENNPNTRVNIMSAYIDGQVASLLEHNIAASVRGESPSDDFFANKIRVFLEWTLKKNKIKRILDQHERRRQLFGVGVFKVFFDEGKLNNFGLVRICCPSLNHIFVDTKIKDVLDIQDADYIVETIRMSRNRFRDIFGEGKTSAISFGSNIETDNNIFGNDAEFEDTDSATLIQYWSRHNGVLRLREITGCGLLLYDSLKPGDRKTNQKNNKKWGKPVYTSVDNQYPYFFTGLYPDARNLFGFGDGKLLLPLQEMLNGLYDKVRITARPNLILFDPASEVDLEGFDENSMEPRPANLSSVRAVETVPWGTVNPAFWQLIQSVHSEAQKVTRFSDIMIGQGRRADTATEASIMQQQGNATTDHKKTLLEETLAELCEYAVKLALQFYESGRAFRSVEDKSEFEWLDFKQLSNVPVKKPASDSFVTEYKKNNPLNSAPEWELLTSGGKTLTREVDFRIDISIGAGLPKNKAFLWQMIERLAGMTLLDSAGASKTLFSYEELRVFMRDYIGLPIDNKQNQSNVLMQDTGGKRPMSLSPQQFMDGNNAFVNSAANPMMNNLPSRGA